MTQARILFLSDKVIFILLNRFDMVFNNGRSIPCVTCYAKHNIVNTKIDLNYCREEGKKYGLTLLSTEYKNVSEKMLWHNNEGKQLELSFRQIQRSKTKVFN